MGEDIEKWEKCKKGQLMGKDREKMGNGER